MSPDALMKLLAEYSNSLTRIEAEKDLLKAIAERAETELCIPAAQFRKLAVDVHKDAIKQSREAMRDMLELYDTVQPVESES
jgi:hypothetical protein